MMRRRRGMGLVGAMATTAVVAGTAGAVRHHQDQKYSNQAAEQQAQDVAYQNQQEVAQLQQQVSDMQAQQAVATVVPAAPAPAANDLTAQLNQLASLKAQGILSDEEFAAAKAKLLGV